MLFLEVSTMNKKISMGIGALVLTAGAFLYGRHDTEKHQYEAVQAKPVALSEPEWAMHLNHEALSYFEKGMERMKAVGVSYRRDQIFLMLRCADREYNSSGKAYRLDVKEARELYEVVLNPDSALGRLAMPLDRIHADKHSVPMPSHYEPLVLCLLDENNDGLVSKEETKNGHARLR
jgi:hypothetical protein